MNKNKNDAIRDDFFNTITYVVDELTQSHKGKAVAKRIAELYGGSMIYVTKNMQDQFDQKYEQIYQEFNGKNVKELAKKYNLSEQAIYRSLRIAKNNKQLNLFD